jgi:hypothetical protein
MSAKPVWSIIKSEDFAVYGCKCIDEWWMTSSMLSKGGIFYLRALAQVCR